ncbi:MAG: FAD-dependent oxidoreductase [Patescibacteria group bacterium]|nr:FAD-dependent oxidoreductase [Patescibacteria group bacterium]
MKAKIKSRETIAQDTIEVKFDLLGEKLDFQAGQYIWVKLNNPPYQDAKGDNRHFTIVNPPEDGSELVIATRVRESAFKRSLNELPIGTEVEVGPLEGDFVLPEDYTTPIVFLAGGIGITPFMSMISHIVNNNLRYLVTVVYSNKSKKSTAFFEQIGEFATQNSNIKVIFTMTDDPDWSGESGRIDKDFIEKHFAYPDENLYMIAGPPEMVQDMYKVLLDCEVANKNITTENFTGY